MWTKVRDWGKRDALRVEDASAKGLQGHSESIAAVFGIPWLAV